MHYYYVTFADPEAEYRKNAMTFSVIVPTYNRLSSLKVTLESLFAQDFTDYEIIVVDDGSVDGTAQYLQELASRNRITCHRHPNSGLAATRRAGLHFARGTYVAFTDDDCVLPRDWLSRLHRDFQDHAVACVAGAARREGHASIFAQANDMINNYFKDALNGRNDRLPFITGNNVAFTLDILTKVGGPDPRFRMGAEDRDLVTRIVRAGGETYYDPGILVDHRNEARLAGFIRHQFEQGKGSALYYRLHPRRGERTFSVPFRTYLGLLAYPFSQYRILRAVGLATLVICAQASVAAGYIAAILRNHDLARGAPAIRIGAK